MSNCKNGNSDSHIHDLKSLDPKIQDLISEATKARNFSYSPYSKFKVGASLLCEDGKTYQGCNVENSSFTVGTCAERCAYFKAISEGQRKFKALAVVAYQEHAFTTPCGACRQFISEFDPVDIYIAKPNEDKVFVTNLRELLPFHFQVLDDCTFTK